MAYFDNNKQLLNVTMTGEPLDAYTKEEIDTKLEALEVTRDDNYDTRPLYKANISIENQKYTFEVRPYTDDAGYVQGVEIAGDVPVFLKDNVMALNVQNGDVTIKNGKITLKKTDDLIFEIEAAASGTYDDYVLNIKDGGGYTWFELGVTQEASGFCYLKIREEMGSVKKAYISGNSWVIMDT
jgi:hypothetical protein